MTRSPFSGNRSPARPFLRCQERRHHPAPTTPSRRRAQILASILIPPRQNSKSEARNPKQCQMSQIENSKRASLQAVHFRDLEIRILNLFRISKFELRISKSKLDQFLNFVVTKKS